MKKIILYPEITTVGKIHPITAVHTIERETMIFSGSPEFVRKQPGAELANMILSSIEDPKLKCPKHLYPVIDTRSHMLMEGMYPAIPGWHCDGVIRDTETGQPDFSKLDPLARHTVVTMSSVPGGTSRTEFVTEPLEVQYDERKVWGSIDEDINEELDPTTISLDDGIITTFNQTTLHRATSTMKKGWRFFFRLSYYHTPPRNQIRNQVQVYTITNQGW
jgi:hypothetical protein